MRRITETVLRHRRIVLLVWIVLLLAGGAAASKTGDRLKIDFSLPGQPGYETAKTLESVYGNGETDPYVITISGASTADADAAFAKLQQQLPDIRLVDHGTSGDTAFVTKDGATSYAYGFAPFPKSFADDPGLKLKATLPTVAPSGSTATATGLTELALNDGGSGGPGVLAETLFGAGGALVVLLFVFASFLALVPLLIAAFSILTTFLIVFGLTYITNVSFVVEFLIALIGLGVAIDYSLLIVTRWREERDHGRHGDDAIIAAMNTAGRAVVFSGVTVAIGLLALIVVPVPLIRSMAYGGVLIPTVSVLVSLTLLPVLLKAAGSRLDWPHVRKEVSASRSWTWWARFIVRWRWIAAGTALVFLLVLAAPVLHLRIGTASSDSLTKSGKAYDALHTLERGGIPVGVLTPMQVLTTPGHAQAVADKVRAVEGVYSATRAGGANEKAGKAVVIVVPVQETSNSDTTAVVKRVIAAVKGDGEVEGVTGTGAIQIDYVKAVYAKFPYVLGVIVLLTFLLLVRAFRSLLLPLKAVLLNLLSLAATFGAMVFFWQDGHGSDALFGIAPTGAITFWEPVLLFAFLYGLSMDYEVFILARVREEYDETGSTDLAVTEGIGRTGRLVTCAALILFLAFISLGSGPQTDVKVLATGLGFGILLDATIVRALLVPALVSLLGRWNWWLPSRFARALRVTGSPLPRQREGADSKTLADARE